MEQITKRTLASWPLSLKILSTALIVTLLSGYLVALVQVYDRSHFDLKKTTLYYRGEETGDENSMRLPQSFTTMLSISHVHTLSQPLLFGFLGLIFVFCGLSEKIKSFFILLGFLGSVISNLAPWLIRYQASYWVYLLPLSQVMFAMSLISMSFISLKKLWIPANKKSG